jgi:hypothetical protein
MVRKKALPYKIEKVKKKNVMHQHVRYSSPRNIGQSPLLSSGERGALRMLGRLCYYDEADDMKNTWNAMGAPEQHEKYIEYVESLKKLYTNYNEASQKVNSRIFKRKNIFSKLSGVEAPKQGKKKQPDSKLVAKYLSDITKDVFSDVEKQEKEPIATDMKTLLMGTIVETKWDELMKKGPKDGPKSLDSQQWDALRKTLSIGDVNHSKLLASKYRKQVNLFLISNQLGVGGNPNDDSGTQPFKDENNTYDLFNEDSE